MKDRFLFDFNCNSKRKWWDSSLRSEAAVEGDNVVEFFSIIFLGKKIEVILVFFIFGVEGCCGNSLRVLNFPDNAGGSPEESELFAREFFIDFERDRGKEILLIFASVFYVRVF